MPSAAGVAAGEHAAADRARPDGDDEPRLRHRLVGAPGGLLEVARHDPGHEEQVGVARRGDEVDPEPLDVVVRVEQRGDLPVAAVARAGVEVADVERASQRPTDRAAEFGGVGGLGARGVRAGRAGSQAASSLRLSAARASSRRPGSRGHGRRARSRLPSRIASRRAGPRAGAAEDAARRRRAPRCPASTPDRPGRTHGRRRRALPSQRAGVELGQAAGGRRQSRRRGRVAARDRAAAERAEEAVEDVQRHRQRSVQA